MKNDIIPPANKQPESYLPPVDAQQPGEPPVVYQQPPAPFAGQTVGQPAVQDPEVSQPPKNPWNKYYKWIFIVIGFGVVLASAAIIWYLTALQPVSAGDTSRTQVTVTSGTSPSQIGSMLHEKKLIRSQFALQVYMRLNGAAGKLLAGSYSLSPSESTGQIVAHLTKGSADQYDVTFYPGATLNIAATGKDKTPSHRQVLEKIGFSAAEIDEAFNASYEAEYPVLFAGKPAPADLEGYIFGQTYKIASGSNVKQILRRTFAEYEKQIKANNLAEAFKARGLTMYEGIILASIIQREVPTTADQKQVAQVFFTRLDSGMMLGSDVTYHYAADKAGIARDHTLDSPYNTRKVAGLPPGPIASPGITALQAVANPASGDYVYFLSGDDDKTYFARTNAEHEANIVNHCAYKCSLP